MPFAAYPYALHAKPLLGMPSLWVLLLHPTFVYSDVVSCPHHHWIRT